MANLRPNLPGARSAAGNAEALQVADARAKARLAKDQAEARRARVRADLAEGKVIPVQAATDQLLSLALGVRSALDKAPAYLPADLSPKERAAAQAALATATAKAFGLLEAKEKAGIHTVSLSFDPVIGR